MSLSTAWKGGLRKFQRLPRPSRFSPAARNCCSRQPCKPSCANKRRRNSNPSFVDSRPLPSGAKRRGFAGRIPLALVTREGIFRLRFASCAHLAHFTIEAFPSRCLLLERPLVSQREPFDSDIFIGLDSSAA